MIQREKFIALLIVLFAWTAFLFSDAIFSAKEENKNPPSSIKNLVFDTSLQKGDTLNNHSSASEFESQVGKLDTQNELSQLTKTVSENLENWINSAKMKIKDINNWIKDLDLLEKIYQKDKNPDVLKILLQNLVEEYQFEKAKTYISDINIFDDKIIEAKTYIYTYINSLSIIDNNSMDKFMSFVDQMRYKSLISSDDYIFYQWLAKIWKKDYEWASILFKQINSPIYTNFISQIDSAIEKFNKQKWVPWYYKDSLIALTALKNWYFSLANKLAVSSVLQNWEYVLPNQILAYSNFLTNNREKSIENFYELVEIDSENQDKYNFYIWVSHYRAGQYQESIWILSKLLNNSKYKTDSYRYLLLNYKALENESKMVQVRQKLLWQDNLQESDFKTYYDYVFYRPFSQDSKYTIYSKHKQLSYDFVSICYQDFWEKNDTCLYGEIWLDVINESRHSVQNWLLYLAENYPQSHIFQALWDYYKSQGLDDKAKTYYLKAVSLSDNTSQKNIIENKIISELD